MLYINIYYVTGCHEYVYILYIYYFCCVEAESESKLKGIK